jgi:hypothetical protein
MSTPSNVPMVLVPYLVVGGDPHLPGAGWLETGHDMSSSPARCSAQWKAGAGIRK